MSRETQAELFISTLTEIWEEQRSQERTRRRLRVKAQVRRFVEEFRTEIRSGRDLGEWIPPTARSARPELPRMRGE